MQGFDVDKFLEDNRWISAAVFFTPDIRDGAFRVCVDLSPQGHGLIRDQGLQEFKKQVSARLLSFGLIEDCWEIRSVPDGFSKQLEPAQRNQFPLVLSKLEYDLQYKLLLDISPDLVWFRGHFPDNPVLPGIVQLHWAVSCSLKLFDICDVPVEIKQLKFKSTVIPPRIVEMALSLAGKNQVRFEYTSLGQIHSQGLLNFYEGELC